MCLSCCLYVLCVSHVGTLCVTCIHFLCSTLPYTLLLASTVRIHVDVGLWISEERYAHVCLSESQTLCMDGITIPIVPVHGKTHLLSCVNEFVQTLLLNVRVHCVCNLVPALFCTRAASLASWSRHHVVVTPLLLSECRWVGHWGYKVDSKLPSHKAQSRLYTIATSAQHVSVHSYMCLNRCVTSTAATCEASASARKKRHVSK